MESHQKILVTGPTGTGKTYIACALANAACRQGCNARYHRVPRLLGELAVARADGSYPRFLAGLARVHLLVLDDWALAPLSPNEGRELLEVIEDRSQARSTIVGSQLPLEHWHSYLGDPSVADAILDRLVHNAHRIELRRELMREVTRKEGQIPEAVR